MIRFILPIKTVSEANSHEHWRARQKRAKGQRFVAATVASGGRHHDWLTLRQGLVVTITRIATHRLDSDNLAGSAKAVRDGIADALRVNDNDERIEWRYAQRKPVPYDEVSFVEVTKSGRRMVYAVEVTIEPREKG